MAYSYTFLANSGENTPSAICNDSKFELLDFFTVGVEVFVFGFVLLLVLFDGVGVGSGSGVGVGSGVGCIIATDFVFPIDISVSVAKSPTVPDAVIVTEPELPAVQVNESELFSSH